VREREKLELEKEIQLLNDKSSIEKQCALRIKTQFCRLEKKLRELERQENSQLTPDDDKPSSPLPEQAICRADSASGRFAAALQGLLIALIIIIPVILILNPSSVHR